MAALSLMYQYGQTIFLGCGRNTQLAFCMQVICTLRRHSLPIFTCRQANDAQGYTPLHWAAHVANCQCIYLLLSETPQPRKAWSTLRSRRTGRTPADVFTDSGCSFFLDDSLLAADAAAVPAQAAWMMQDDTHSSGSCPGNWHLDTDDTNDCDDEVQSHLGASAKPTSRQCRMRGSKSDVFGCSVVAALKCRTRTSQLSFLAAYSAMCLLLGWWDTMTWATLALTLVMLHLMLPLLHREVYLKGLEEVRAAAASCGLRVSWSFSFVGSPQVQRKYDLFIAKHAASGIAFKSFIFLATVLLVTAPSGDLLAAILSPLCKPALTLLACTTVALRTWAVCTRRYCLWRWLDIFLDWYVPLGHCLPAVYPVLTGHHVLKDYPFRLMHQAADTVDLLAVMAGSAFAATLGAVLSLALTKPLSMFSVRSEVGYVSVSSLVSLPAYTAVVHASDLRRAQVVMTVMLGAVYRLSLFVLRVRCEHHDMRKFLRTHLAQKSKFSE